MPLTNPWTAFVDPVLNWSSLAVLSLDQPSMWCRQWQPATIRHNEYRLSISPNWSSKKAWKAAQLEEYLWASCYLVSMRAHGSIWSIVARSQAAQIRGQHKHSPTLIGCCSIRPCHIPKTQDLGTLTQNSTKGALQCWLPWNTIKTQPVQHDNDIRLTCHRDTLNSTGNPWEPLGLGPSLTGPRQSNSKV